MKRYKRIKAMKAQHLLAEKQIITDISESSRKSEVIQHDLHCGKTHSMFKIRFLKIVRSISVRKTRENISYSD